MNVRELALKDSGEVALYACGACGTVYSPKAYAVKDDLAHDAARGVAERCCAPRHCACGVPLQKYWTACDACREQRMLLKAEVVDVARYAGPVYAEGVGDWDEGYSSSVEGLLEYCDDNDEPSPSYCHPCKTIPLRIDVDSVLEHALDGHHEGADDQVVGYDDLADCIRRWNDLQHCQSFEADTSRVIVLDRARFDDLLAGWRPIDTAPHDRPIQARIPGHGDDTVIALQDGLLDSNGDSCCGWIAIDEQEPPEDWTDGVCWEVNTDGEPSTKPTHWKPLETITAGADQ